MLSDAIRNRHGHAQVRAGHTLGQNLNPHLLWVRKCHFCEKYLYQEYNSIAQFPIALSQEMRTPPEIVSPPRLSSCITGRTKHLSDEHITTEQVYPCLAPPKRDAVTLRSSIIRHRVHICEPAPPKQYTNRQMSVGAHWSTLFQCCGSFGLGSAHSHSRWTCGKPPSTPGRTTNRPSHPGPCASC